VVDAYTNLPFRMLSFYTVKAKVTPL
jgi:hypothetical protein